MVVVEESRKPLISLISPIGGGAGANSVRAQ